MPRPQKIYTISIERNLNPGERVYSAIVRVGKDDIYDCHSDNPKQLAKSIYKWISENLA